MIIAVRLPILLSSLAKYTSNKTVHSLVMVVPDEDKPTFKDAFVDRDVQVLMKVFYGHRLHRELGLAPLSYPVKVFGDSELLSAPLSEYKRLTPIAEKTGDGRGTGYRLSMLLKLAAASVVPTPFYVTLDLDVFMTAPLRLDEACARGPVLGWTLRTI